MTPNEYLILLLFDDTDTVTLRQVAKHLENPVGYTKYLCAGMVNRDLLTECVDDSGKRPRRAYRLTPKSQAILADLWRGMVKNLRGRVARARRITAIVEERADRIEEMATAANVSDE